MKNQKIAKLVALGTAATMMLAPATVFAEDVTNAAGAAGSIEGEGQLEGYVNKEAFRIVLPTVKNINFTLDPQGLLNKSDATKYTNANKGAIYFTNAPTTENGSATYSSTSDEIKFLNKSSYPVEVELSVELDTGDDIKLVGNSALATVTEPSINLQLVQDAGTPADILTSSYTTQTPAVVAKVPEIGETVDGAAATKGYEITSSTTPIEGVTKSPNGYYYTYSLNSTFTDADAKGVVYKLTGSCDSTADWSKIGTEAVTAKIAWSVNKQGAPRAIGTAYNRSSKSNTYTLKNVTKEIKSIDISTDGKTAALSVPDAAYTLSADKSTLTINGLKAGVGTAADGKVRYFIVTFDDDSTMVFSVNVKNTGDFSFSRKATDNSYTLTGNTQEIKSMVISVDGTTSAATVPADAYALDNSDKTALTIDGTKAGIGAAAVGSIRHLIITFADDTTTTISVNVSE